MAVAARPKRSWLDWFSAFMEERNIRWGELVGGLLIVCCSVALVISFWSAIEQRPWLKFLLFNGVTAALLGIGFYSEFRWRLRTTAQGLLTIGCLLVPLNFLAIAALSSAPGTGGLVTIAGEMLSAALFAALLYFAGQVLIERDAPWFAAGLLVPSLAQLLVRRYVDPATSTAMLAALAAVPVGCYAVVNLWHLRAQARTLVLSEQQVNALLKFVGMTSFAVVLPLALLLYKTERPIETLRQLPALAGLLGFVPLCAGLLLWQKLAGRTLVALRTAGTSVAVFGGAGVVVRPGHRLARAERDVAGGARRVCDLQLRGLAVRLAGRTCPGGCLPVRSLPAGCSPGRRANHVDRQFRRRVGPYSRFRRKRHAVGAAGRGLRRRGTGRLAARGRRRRALGTAAAGLMAASVVLVSWFGFGYEGDPLGAGWVYLLYALVILALAARVHRAAGLVRLRATIGRRRRDGHVPLRRRVGTARAGTHFHVGLLHAQRHDRRNRAPPAPGRGRRPVLRNSLAGVLLHLARGRRLAAGARSRRAGRHRVLALGLAGRALARRGDRHRLAADRHLVPTRPGRGHGVWRRHRALRGAWFVHTDWPWLDPWTLQSVALGLVALNLVWAVVRLVCRDVSAGTTLGTWRAQAASRLASPWLAIDRVTTGLLVALLVGLSVYAVLPGVLVEISPFDRVPAATAQDFQWHGIHHLHAGQGGSWALVGALLVLLAVMLRERASRSWLQVRATGRGRECSVGSQPFRRARRRRQRAGLDFAPLLVARRRGALVPAAARALGSARRLADVLRRRWRTARYDGTGRRPRPLCARRVGGDRCRGSPRARRGRAAAISGIGSIGAHARAVRDPRGDGPLGSVPLLVRAAARGVRPTWPESSAALVLLLAVIPPLAFSLHHITASLAASPIRGPDAQSIFARLGPPVALAVPLVLVALAMVGFALRERSGGFGLAGGLAACAAATVAWMAVHWTIVPLEAGPWIRVAQLNAAVAAAYTLAWLAVVAWDRSREGHYGFSATSVGFHVQAALAPVTIGLALGWAWRGAVLASDDVSQWPAGRAAVGRRLGPGQLCRGVPGGRSRCAHSRPAIEHAHAERRAGRGGHARRRRGGALGPGQLGRLQHAVHRPRARRRRAGGPGLASALRRVPHRRRRALARRRRSARRSARAMWPLLQGLLVLCLAVRQFQANEWFSIAGLAYVGLAVLPSLAWIFQRRRYLYLAVPLVNWAGLAAADQLGWISGTPGFVYGNIILLAAPVPLWLVVELFGIRPRAFASRLEVPPVHRVMTRLAAAILAVVVGIELTRDATAVPGVISAGNLPWFALAATTVAALAGLWDARSRDAVTLLYALGILAIGVLLDSFNLTPPWLLWTGTLVAAAYALATSYLWSRRRGLAAIAQRLGVPRGEDDLAGLDWLVPCNAVLVSAVVLLTTWVELTNLQTHLRVLAAQATLVQVVSLALLARGDHRGNLQYGALVVGALAPCCSAGRGSKWALRSPCCTPSLSWAPPLPAWACSTVWASPSCCATPAIGSARRET